jgi:hypothetical protein
MQGRPVWLASLSKKELGRRDRIKAVASWSDAEVQHGYERLCWALRGCGDPTKERLFRMNVTLCLHRAATRQEVAGLPEGWRADEGAMAGGPVAVIWSRGVPCPPSCLPCRDPGKYLPDPKRPDLWVPLDCQKCPPCLARAEVAARGGHALATP